VDDAASFVCQDDQHEEESARGRARLVGLLNLYYRAA
jgi:hypothetical protein